MKVVALEPIRVLQEDAVLEAAGIEALLMNVYRHIDREKIQFDFMVHRPEHAFYDDEVESLGGRIYKTPRFSPIPGQYQTYMSSMEEILRSHPEYKIIHAHTELNLWPLMVAKKIGVPVRIAHSHNAKRTVNLKYFFFLYEKPRIKKYCTDMFMCSTPAGIWTFGEDAVKSGKVKFIKNGIESERFVFNEAFRTKKREELGFGDKFVVGHVGRFMTQKNHIFLIEIFNEIYKRNPNSVLLLIGAEGPLEAKIEKRIHDLNLQKSVVKLTNRRDVNELMQAMDVFLFPSLWEGLPLTGIEAQTAGLPVVMSDAVTKEVCVTNNVYQLSLDLSAETWADKVLKTTNSFKRENVRQQIIDSGFDIRTTAEYLQEFYTRKHFGIRNG